jgi:hypothetical protein
VITTKYTILPIVEYFEDKYFWHNYPDIDPVYAIFREPDSSDPERWVAMFVDKKDAEFFLDMIKEHDYGS